MPRISIIIANYNTRDLLDKCLTNLNAECPVCDVIVVDNASTDGSADMVAQKYSHVILLAKDQNLGIAKSYNLGLQRATGDYILFLGTDAYPTNNTLVELATYLDKHPEIGIATCKLITASGGLDWDAHRGFPTPWAALTHFSSLNKLFPKSRIFNQYFLGYEDLTKPHEIGMCISHFMFVRKQVFEKVITWDERYFVFGEDVDFCYRVKEAGWKIMYLPMWEVIHLKGGGIPRKGTVNIQNASTQSKEAQERVRKETTRAMKLFYDTHYSTKYPKIVTNIVLLGITCVEKLRAMRA